MNAATTMMMTATMNFCERNTCIMGS